MQNDMARMHKIEIHTKQVYHIVVVALDQNLYDTVRLHQELKISKKSSNHFCSMHTLTGFIHKPHLLTAFYKVLLQKS